MYRLEISIINPEANDIFFDKWLKETYDDYTGLTRGGIIILYFTNNPSFSKKSNIENFYNNITESDCLHVYQTFKINEIRIRTNQLILQGYVFGGKTFALHRDVDGVYTTDPQTNILALNTSKDELIYPIVFNTIDGFDYFICQNSEDIELMYSTALQTKKSYLDNETTLIQSVRSALSKSDLDLIIDNR